MTGSGPTTPFRNADRNGIRSGKRIRRVVVTGSSPVSCSRFLTSAIVSQLRTGVRRFRCRQLEHGERRPPELAVGVDDDPRVAVRVRGDVAEEREQVVDVGHEVGEDDVVEGLAELELLARLGSKLELRMPRPRASSTIPGLTSTPRPRAGSSAASRSPFAAPDLEHRRARAHDRLVHGLDQPVIAARASARAARLGEAIERLRHLGVVPGDTRRSPCGNP